MAGGSLTNAYPVLALTSEMKLRIKCYHAIRCTFGDIKELCYPGKILFRDIAVFLLRLLQNRNELILGTVKGA